MFAALVLAQLMHTPAPFMTATPAPVSERAVLDRGLDEAVARAKALHGTLGAVVEDLSTGTAVFRNEDASFPMQSVDKLLIGVLTLRAVDAGKLQLTQSVNLQPGNVPHTVTDLLTIMLERSDSRAADALLVLLGGIDSANAQVRDLGYTTLLIGPHQSGFGTPAGIAKMLTAIRSGPLLSAASRTMLLGMMAATQTGPDRLRAGFPAGTLVAHRTGTAPTLDGITAATNDVGIVTIGGRSFIIVAMLRNARGDEVQRDGVVAEVAHAVYDVTQQFRL